MEPSDIVSIRSEASLSQSELAAILNVTVKCVQMWEQGYRRPRGPAVVVLEEIRVRSRKEDALPMERKS